MDLKLIELEKNIQVVVIKNFLDKQEYREVFNEISIYLKVNLINYDNPITGTAVLNGEHFAKEKQSLNLFPNSVYPKYYKKFLGEIKKMCQSKSLSISYRSLINSNQDVSWFAKCSNFHEYKSHVDVNTFTQLYYIHKEPKKFTGGDLVFDDFDYTIPYENNVMILFPGYLNHSVTKVESTKKLKSIDCRFVFTTFYGVKLDR